MSRYECKIIDCDVLKHRLEKNHSTCLYFKNKATLPCMITIYMCVERNRYTFTNLN